MDSDDDGARRHAGVPVASPASASGAGSFRDLGVAARGATSVYDGDEGNRHDDSVTHRPRGEGDGADETASVSREESLAGGLARSVTPASLAASNAPTPSLLSSVYDPRLLRSSSATPTAAALPPFIASYTRQYHQRARVAYNTMIQLPRRLRTPWIVFATGMVFVHHFVERHDWDLIDPVILACAGFSLASKAENCGHARAAHIIEAVFRLSLRHGRHGHPPQPMRPGQQGSSNSAASGSSAPPVPSPSSASPLPPSGANAGAAPQHNTLTVAEEIAIRKEQILTAEMAMLKALDFSVVRRLPFDRMVALAAHLYPHLRKPNQSASMPGRRPSDGPGTPSVPQPPPPPPPAEEQPDPPLLEVSKKILSYTLMTPMCVHLSANEIADGIVSLVARALGVFDELDGAMQCTGDMWTTTDAVRRGIERTVYTCLIYADKRTGVAPIDDLARLHAQRARRAMAASSSSGGSTAGGPTAPPVGPSPTSAVAGGGGNWLEFGSPAALGSAGIGATRHTPERLGR